MYLRENIARNMRNERNLERGRPISVEKEQGQQNVKK